MKYGINTFLFTYPFNNRSIRLFTDFKKMGFDGVEITLNNKGDFNYKEALKVLKDNSLKCCSICGIYGRGRDLRGSDNAQEMTKQYIRDCIDACGALECDLFVGPHYSEVGRAQMETKDARREQWKAVVKNLKEVCQYAEDKGVYIAIEPVNRFATDFINTCADARRMIEDVGSEMLKIHLDTFHMNIEEKSLSMAVLDADDNLYNFHVSEKDRGAPGTGTIDWKGIKDALVKIHYSRYVVIESFTPDVEIGALSASIWRATEKSNIDLAKKGLFFLKTLFSN
ncbi:MAG: sugar phosphate isomerase/epimerase family protein [Planctomycetota bacterium]|jgi:D-psicose/D-tagatose/L-ribulose 3-epimerase